MRKPEDEYCRGLAALEHGDLLEALPALAFAYLHRAPSFESIHENDAPMWSVQEKLCARGGWPTVLTPDARAEPDAFERARVVLCFEEWWFDAIEDRGEQRELLADLERLWPLHDDDVWRELAELGADVEGFRTAGAPPLEAWRAAAVHLSPRSWTALRTHGVPPRRWPKWAKLAVDDEDRPIWIEHGRMFDPTKLSAFTGGALPGKAAVGFALGGVEPDEARDWHRLGITPEEARRLRQNGFFALRPDDVARWIDAAFSADEVLPWMAAGIAFPEKADEHRRAGYTPDDVARVTLAEPWLAEWEAASFREVAARIWAREEMRPNVARAFRDRGFHPIDAGPWARAGVAPDVASRWKRVDLPVEQRIELALDDVPAHHHELFHDASVRASWRATPLSLTDAVAWMRAGFAPPDAALWHQRDWSPPHAQSLAREGFTPDEAERWKAAGFVHSYELQNWRRCGFEPETGAPYREHGFGNVDAQFVHEAGGTADEGARFRDAGIVPIRSRSFFRIGLGFERAMQIPDIAEHGWAADAIFAQGVTDVVPWLDAGLPFDPVIGEWHAYGFSPDEAARHWRRFVGPAIAKRLTRPPEELVPYERSDPDWHKTQLSSAVRRRVRVADRARMVEHWVELGYAESEESLENALPWVRADFESVIADAWRREGFTLAEARRWRDRGFDGPKHVPRP